MRHFSNSPRRISNIEDLRVQFTHFIDIFNQDSLRNPFYKQIDARDFKRIQEVISTTKDRIQVLFNNLKQTEETIKIIIGTIAETSNDGSIVGNRALLTVEHSELIQKYEDMVKTVENYITIFQSPLFGILKIKDEVKTSYVYIGKQGVMNNEMAVLVSDWRSEIGQLFYQSTKPGDTFNIKINDHTKQISVLEKYNLTFRDSILVNASNLFKDKYDIQENLTKDLQVRKGGKFKDIITTIQAEQDKIIQLPLDYSIAIQGCAGSGKTSIAVHRLSKLIFNNPKKLNPERVLYLTPNKLFTDYLEDVQTAMGLEGVKFQTYLTWAVDILFRDTELLDSKVNVHPKLINTDVQQSIQIDYQKAKNIIYSYIRSKLKNYNIDLKKQLKEDYEKTTEVQVVINQLEHDFILKDIIYLQNEAFINTQGVSKRFKTKFTKILKDIEIFPLLNYLLTQLDIESQYSARYSNDMNNLYVNFSKAELSALLLVRDIIYGAGDIKNQLLIIDEVQNYDAVQVNTQLHHTYHNKFMLVGDLHQQHNSEGIKNINLENADIAPYVNHQKSLSTVINTCYRTTQNIMEYSYNPFGDKIIESIKAKKYFRKGQEVSILNKVALSEVLKESARKADLQNFSTIAIISDLETLTNLQTELNKEFKKDNWKEMISGYKVLSIGENNYQKGIFLLEPQDIIGLEFDLVIYTTASDNKVEHNSWIDSCKTHVILSRAMHELVVIK